MALSVQGLWITRRYLCAQALPPRLCLSLFVGRPDRACMLPDKKRNTNIGVGVGIILQLSRFILVRQGIISPDVGLVIWGLGMVFFVCGCVNYAEGKGASRWFGLLGLLSLIGLLGLFFLPDRHKDGN